MGASAYILFEAGKSISASELVSTLKKSSEEKGLFFNNDINRIDDTGRLKYQRVCISDKPPLKQDRKEICFNVYDEPYQFRTEQFDWDDLHKDYFNAISLESFVEKEDLLLQILSPLLLNYPQAKFWCDNNWFYTIEVMERIINNPYNDLWCYEDPAAL